MGVTGTERDLSTRLAEFRRRTPLSEIAAVLGCGEPTLADIFDQLLQPGRDPRALQIFDGIADRAVDQQEHDRAQRNLIDDAADLRISE